jgi:hypothetical protein
VPKAKTPVNVEVRKALYTTLDKTRVRPTAVAPQTGTKYLCTMDPWSGCGTTVDEIAEAKYQRPRRGLCHNCYQILWDFVSNRRLAKWEEFEEAGMCRPIRRCTQARVLSVLIARRSMAHQ